MSPLSTRKTVKPVGYRPVTIAHVLIGQHIGGLERVVINLITGVDHSRFHNVLCYIEYQGDWLDQVSRSCGAVKAFNKKPGVSCTLPFRLAHFFRTQSVDLVHCHDFAAYLYGAIGGRFANCGVVYTIHGPHVFFKKRQLLLQSLPLAHKVVAVSEHIRSQALRKLRVNPQRIVTIRNGVNTEQLAVPRRRQGNLTERVESPHSSVVGCIARLVPEKDHDTLLLAFARVVSQHPGVRLLIVGDGPLRSHIEKRVADLGLGTAVTLLGTQHDIGQVLAGLDVFVLSSREEGLPLALLEAMAAGIPVVATNVGGVPQTVVHGETGLLVPPGDPNQLASALLRVLSDQVLAFKMGHESVTLVKEHYEASQMVQAYQNLYTSLIRRRSQY